MRSIRLFALAAAGLVACGDGAAPDTTTAYETADTTAADDDTTAAGDDTSTTGDDTSATGDDSAAPADDTAPPTTPDTLVDVVLGDPDVLVGSFQVALVPPDPATDTPGTTAILGIVYDGPTPAPVIFHPSTVSGDCTLHLPEVPFCSVACVGGALCVADDTCRDFPNTVDVGDVTVTGVTDGAGHTTFTMEAIGGAYQPSGPSLPYPAFAAGAELAVATAGGSLAPFAIAGRGIAPLEVTSTDLLVAPDTALALTWTPGDPALADIVVKLDISHHGGTKGDIRCTTADDGALTIDAALIDELLDLGYSGLPTVKIARRGVGHTVTEHGRVELEVLAERELPVEIPGLVSCVDDAQCPEDQTCQNDLRCR